MIIRLKKHIGGSKSNKNIFSKLSEKRTEVNYIYKERI